MERVIEHVDRATSSARSSTDAATFADCSSSSAYSREATLALQRLLDGELADFETSLAGQLDSQYASVKRIMESASALSGKRLRPRLVLLSALACGGITLQTRRIAMVVEMVHAATLLHDDVLDNSDKRRGAPASHVLWGNRNSILLGDVLFSRAYTLAATLGSCFVAERVGRAGLSLCEGELRQQNAIGCWSLRVDEYLDILKQKTGDLCAASSLLGAWSSDANDSVMRCLETYGSQLGIAFQIYDDWLDVWGTAMLGKPLYNDIANRKPTLPTLRLLEQASVAERPRMVELLDKGNMSDGLRSALDESDASQVTLEMARRFAESACAELACLPDSPAKFALIQVAQQSVRRAR